MQQLKRALAIDILIIPRHIKHYIILLKSENRIWWKFYCSFSQSDGCKDYL